MAPMPWDAALYRDFGRFAFAYVPPKDKALVEAKLRDLGHSVTWNAIRQHFQKMNKVGKTATNSSAASARSSASKSPAANLRPASTRRAATSAKARTKRLAEASDDDDDGEHKTPAKKRIKTEEISTPTNQMENDQASSTFDDLEVSGESAVQDTMALLNSTWAPPSQHEENTQLTLPTPEDSVNDPSEV